MANDFHFPNHDTTVLALFLIFLRDYQPDILVINGDLIDCYELSEFKKSAWLQHPIEKEFELAEKFFKKVKEFCPKTRIIYIFGNHEKRLAKYISNNAEKMARLKGMTLESIMGLDDYGIDYLPCPLEMSKFTHNYIDLGGLLYGHFDKVSMHSAYTAKNLMDTLGRSFIQGHTHRGGVYYKTQGEKVLIGVENFCMCSLKPDYTSLVNWQNGYSIINYTGGEFNIRPVPIINYKFIINNKKYVG